jgi:hypothetical protein
MCSPTHLLFASWLTLFCNILSRQPPPSPQEPDSIPNQALNYWSEIEKTEVLADIQGDKDDAGGSNDKKDKKSSSSKDDKNDKKSPSSKDDSKPAPKPTRKPSKERETGPKPTPKPTKKLRSNPTRKPTRKPSGSRSSSLIKQNWSKNECSSKNLSKRCKELNDTVCSQNRLSSDARVVCIKVGLLKSENLYSEDAEFYNEFQYVADEE